MEGTATATDAPPLESVGTSAPAHQSGPGASLAAPSGEPQTTAPRRRCLPCCGRPPREPGDSAADPGPPVQELFGATDENTAVAPNNKPQPIIVSAPTPDARPTKAMGPAGKQAKVWVTKLDGGRQSMRLELDPGFDWREAVAPKLPGCPQWCPATRFGVLQSGCLKLQMEDGSEFVINAGDTYFVPPGHLPLVEGSEKAIMIEFSQETTIPSDKFIKKEVLLKFLDGGG